MTLAARRFALGVATGFVLAVTLLAACGGNLTEEDTLYVKEHLYLNGLRRHEIRGQHRQGRKRQRGGDSDARWQVGEVFCQLSISARNVA